MPPIGYFRAELTLFHKDVSQSLFLMDSTKTDRQMDHYVHRIKSFEQLNSFQFSGDGKYGPYDDFWLPSEFCLMIAGNNVTVVLFSTVYPPPCVGHVCSIKTSLENFTFFFVTQQGIDHNITRLQILFFIFVKWTLDYSWLLQFVHPSSNWTIFFVLYNHLLWPPSHRPCFPPTLHPSFLCPWALRSNSEQLRGLL